METVKRTLMPVAGFSREIGFYLSCWEKTRAELREIVSDLSREELAAGILPGAHQIGGLILHLGESEASWIHAIIDGRELDEEEKKFVHWATRPRRILPKKVIRRVTASRKSTKSARCRAEFWRG